MTEQEWLGCTDPAKMLAFVRDKTGERKHRLYLCGGCRQITHLFFRPASLTVVEVGERFADGEATLEDLKRAEWDAESPTFGYELDERALPYNAPYRMEVVPRLVEMGALPESALTGGEWQVDETAKQRLLAAAELAWHCGFWPAEPSERYRELSFLSRSDWPGRWLFDCVFGNPFRSATIRPVWRTSTVTTVAKGIYDDRTFDHLPILADALEEAGCTDEASLAHLRGPGPHVRGCWPLDLLLGKE